MTNHEPRPIVKTVDLFLAFARPKDGEANRKCIRTIIRDYEQDLAILEAKLKIIGGVWRIHKTVNSRDCEKARLWLLHKLIDNPEFAGCVDSLWRTALLQPECKATDYFMFDVDTKEENIIADVVNLIRSNIISRVKTPNGWHYITKPFDTREVCKWSCVSLKRDGYIFIKKVETNDKH